MSFTSRGNISNEFLVMAALTLLAVLLRWPYLGSPLSGDEAITFNRYAFLPWKSLLLNYDESNQHTLFSLLSSFCMELFGENERSFRLPSFLAGVFAVPLSYRVSLFFFNSKSASVAASCLLAVSSPHLSYSQQGRGYALTVFLALAMVFIATKLIQNRNALAWGTLLVISGFCMALTLPTNVFFLAAVAVYYFAAHWEIRGKDRIVFNKNFVAASISFLVLLTFVAAYFNTIYERIKLGLESLSYVTISLSRFLGIGEFLISPWSPWLFIVFVYGCWNLESRRLPFLCLLITPLLLAILTGVMGFSRIYIYYLPFVFMLVALGMVRFVARIKQLNKISGYAFSALLLAGMIFPPAAFLTNYYPSRADASEVTITEAKQVLSYAQKEIPRHQLIVILTVGANEENVLNYYLKMRIREDMLGFVRGRKLDKIIFISHRDLPVWNYPFVEYYSTDRSLSIQPHALKRIKAIGNLRIDEFDMKISRVIPPFYDPDYESHLTVEGSTKISIQSVENPKAVGKQSLMVKREGEGDFLVGSPSSKKMDVKKDGAYLLFVYARKYGQTSKAMVAEYNRNKWPPTIGYLNPYLGRFKIARSDFVWQAVFALSPIDKGLHNLRKLIHVADETSYFDGFQSFLLSP